MHVIGVQVPVRYRPKIHRPHEKDRRRDDARPVESGVIPPGWDEIVNVRVQYESKVQGQWTQVFC